MSRLSKHDVLALKLLAHETESESGKAAIVRVLNANKPVLVEKYTRESWYDARCPYCRSEVMYLNANYCWYCGQAITRVEKEDCDNEQH